MENWPVKPFTTLSETARMMFTPTFTRMMAQSAGASRCAAIRTGSPARNGSKERRMAARRLT
jgi:hypothetical protein